MARRLPVWIAFWRFGLASACALVAPLIAATAIPVQATALCLVDVRESNHGEVGGASGDCPLDSGDISAQFGIGSLSGRAAAEAGLLRARILTFGLLAGAESRFQFNVFFSGPPGSVSIPVGLNLQVDGSMALTTAGSHAEIFMNVFFNGSPVSQSVYSPAHEDGLGHAVPPLGTDLFAGLSGDSIHGTFTSSGEMFANDVNSVGVAIGAGAAGGSSDFFNTIHFPFGGPVFDLPDGFTANSVDGSIVNNRWTGGPQAVPEPPTWMLMGLGIVGLLVGLQRRKQPTA